MFPPNTHILLVDDMKGVRLLISKLLKELGFQTISEADNGKEALAVLESSANAGNPIGLIIADLRMPVMDGLELLRHIRTEKKLTELPFIMLTAEAEKDNVVKAVKNGVSDYVVKPTSAPILSKKLANAWNVHFGKK